MQLLQLVHGRRKKIVGAILEVNAVGLEGRRLCEGRAREGTPVDEGETVGLLAREADPKRGDGRDELGCVLAAAEGAAGERCHLHSSAPTVKAREARRAATAAGDERCDLDSKSSEVRQGEA